MTFFLLFAGGMVTSTESGLAVPDWPLSYGMLFPPMVGGVFYEHGHRMVASLVGFMTLGLIVALWRNEERRWVRTLGLCALLCVIAQGLLGGITVLFFLPTAISVSHAILGQTFFLLTIILAYSQSDEIFTRLSSSENGSSFFFKWILGGIVLLYLQLLLGAVMRHTGSGLAIYDFPTHAGEWWPSFSDKMLLKINDWRFSQNLDDVKMNQVVFHFLHRCGAVVVTFYIWGMSFYGFKRFKNSETLTGTLYWVNAILLFQLMLGMMTIWSAKAPVPTSLHVVTGAALLGLMLILALRTCQYSSCQVGVKP